MKDAIRTQTRLFSCGFDSSVGIPSIAPVTQGFESRSKPDFFQVIFPVVLWLHSHLSFFHLKLSSYLHNLITLCPVFRCCCCFKSFYAIRSSKQTFLKFQHKDKEPLPGCTIEISYLFLFTLIYLII